MSIVQSLYQRYKRIRTLQTGYIHTLPIVILMPHSACNCRCVMCDIWKDNKNLKQLTENDIKDLLHALKKLGTQQVVMSGGEALLNPNFFRLCAILKQQDISISLLSTGLLLKKHAVAILQYVDDVIISLDGDEATHNYIRNIPDAFVKLKEGVASLKELNPRFRVSGRSVIHQLNFRVWPQIIETAKEMQLDSISFLPADVSSHAFNREVLWSNQRQQEILPAKEDLTELNEILEHLIKEYSVEIGNGFVAESAEKLRKIGSYYSAFYGLNPFPFKKCNAPWVSAVIEADGTVRPCFFHEAIGNIHEKDLNGIINSEKAFSFRKQLDMDNNSICKKCVCYLNLSPGTRLN
jgi:MoaA/NifB/PqqE/SkfB family radical SAM enzyme